MARRRPWSPTRWRLKGDAVAGPARRGAGTPALRFAAVASDRLMEVIKVGSLSPWHLVLPVVVVILLFGAKKLPDAARSLGKSMRIFKSELREMQTEGKSEAPSLQTSSEP